MTTSVAAATATLDRGGVHRNGKKMPLSRKTYEAAKGLRWALQQARELSSLGEVCGGRGRGNGEVAQVFTGATANQADTFERRGIRELALSEVLCCFTTRDVVCSESCTAPFLKENAHGDLPGFSDVP